MNRKQTLVTVALAVALVLGGAVADLTAQTGADSSAAVKTLLDEARKLGAKGQLPLTWWDLDQRYDAARETGADAVTWDQLLTDATRLRNQAAFIDDMRQRKSGMEALLGRFDQALAEIAALSGVTMDRELTGTSLSADLLTKLQGEQLRRRVLVDSLTVANRRLNEAVGGSMAVQDSQITALHVEVSALRQTLWETELRVGVAEADRSAAEVVLSRKQQHEDAIAQVRLNFTPEEAEVLVTGDGSVVLRVHGIAFAVGSAQVSAGQENLVARLAAAVGLFPGASLNVEGHTDDTGSRDANLRLSRRRAETVAVLLAESLGRDPAAISTTGYGPDRPVALNSTVEGRALNRRIDVVIGMVQ
ncbi:hypothetical protein DRQ50_10000 [bacterium]|nr:MAG: hypothetical protein DRQ50_10000 [bacterium]